MNVLLKALVASIGIIVVVCTADTTSIPFEGSSVSKANWFRAGLLDMYNMRLGSFEIAGLRQDSAALPINLMGIVIGRQIEVAPWFRTSLLGNLGYGYVPVDTQMVTLSLGGGTPSDRNSEIGQDLIVASLALEGYCLAPGTLGVTPFLAARADVSFASLKSRGTTIDAGTRYSVELSDGAQSSQIVGALGFGAGVSFALPRQAALTLRYIYSRWNPVKYAYKDGLLTDGVPYSELFRSHSFVLTYDWMRH